MKLINRLKKGTLSGNILSGTIDVVGGAWGIANIKDFAGLFVTILVAVNLIINLYARITDAIKKYKAGDKEGAKEDVKEAVKTGKEVYDTVKPVVEDFLDDGKLNGSNKDNDEVKKDGNN